MLHWPIPDLTVNWKRKLSPWYNSQILGISFDPDEIELLKAKTLTFQSYNVPHLDISNINNIKKGQSVAAKTRSNFSNIGTEGGSCVDLS